MSILSMDGVVSDDGNGELPKDPLFKGDELLVELVVFDDVVLGK